MEVTGGIFYYLFLFIARIIVSDLGENCQPGTISDNAAYCLPWVTQHQLSWSLSRETTYFDVVELVFISTASSPARFATPEASLCQDLLPGRWSTVTKSSLGSISWATVLISAHQVMCKTQMWSVNTPSKHKTFTQCWSSSGPSSVMLAQHKSSTGSTPRVCWAAGHAVQADTDPMPVKC